MPRPPRRILVRGVNWLGDAVMTTPALLRLRQAFPEARISLLIHEKLADLWWQHPAVDSVLLFTSDDTLWTVSRQLREQEADLGLALPNSPRAALELWLARIPRRVGYRRPWRNWFLTQAVPPRPEAVLMRKRSLAEIRGLSQSPVPATPRRLPPQAHQLFEYLHLAAALGASAEPLPPRVVVTEAEVSALQRRFGRPETPPRSVLLGLNPGAEYGPAKRWPQERFVAAAVELQRRTQCACWIFGGQADQELAAALVRDIQQAKVAPANTVRNLAGQTSLRELCAALKACDLLLTNDTGPMHVAVAVGTPVVVPFGSTAPDLTGPWGAHPPHAILQAQVPCAPCFRRNCPIDLRCLNQIEVPAVVAEVIRLLEPRRRAAGR